MSEAQKHDAEKAPLYFLPLRPLEETARVLAFGAKKYAKDNWKKGMAWSRCISAAMRHLLAYAGGEDLDPETGLSHMGHLMCCAMFLEEYRQTGTGTDDRKETKSERH